MSFQTYTRPRRAAVRPAVRRPGPVTLAIRGIRPNELPSWEIREAEMRRQEAADLLALRRRVAKAVAHGIDFLDATGGDPEMEEGEPAEETLGWCENVRQFGLDPNTADGDATALERHGAGFVRSGHEDDEDDEREAGDDNGIADADGQIEQGLGFYKGAFA